uniref:Uncharacterized protein n=1 Tax=viral metagenome TaxID=1070528 RepID=A0A6H1ZWK7_9ZZZZ
MTYNQLILATELLKAVRDGDGEGFTIEDDEKIDIVDVINYFINIKLDIDKQKAKSKEPIIYYQLAIEVNK